MTAASPPVFTRSAFATLLEDRLDRLIDLWHKFGAHDPTFGAPLMDSAEEVRARYLHSLVLVVFIGDFVETQAFLTQLARNAGVQVNVRQVFFSAGHPIDSGNETIVNEVTHYEGAPPFSSKQHIREKSSTLMMPVMVPHRGSPKANYACSGKI